MTNKLSVRLVDNHPKFVGRLSTVGPTFVGRITGVGPIGPPGLTAYELWIKAGNTGTIEDFLNILNISANLVIENDSRNFITALEKANLKGHVHDQQLASDRWVIDHELDKFPSVSVMDTGGNLIMGDVEYVSRSRLIIHYNFAFSGTAALN